MSCLSISVYFLFFLISQGDSHKKVQKAHERIGLYPCMCFFWLIVAVSLLSGVFSHIKDHKSGKIKWCFFYPYSEGRRLKPHTLMAMVQNLLYERRFGPYFVEPVIAGLDPATKEPYICALDLIGCGCEPADFVVSGTCSESLYGRVITTKCISSLPCYWSLNIIVVQALYHTHQE